MALIDLKDLAQRESERVEWKENVADIEDVIKTSVAFANDYSNLGGGYIVCGAKEIKDEHGFQKLVEVGLTSSRLKEIEGKVLTDLREKAFPPIIPLTEELIVSEDHRILVFIIPSSKDAHSYRASGKDASTYYVRIGRETREAKNGILRELLIQKRELEPWDKRINSRAELTDIDLIVLREYLQEMKVWDPNKALEDYLSDNERISSFVSPLVEKERITNILKPRNFTLLMFGKDPLKFFSGGYVVFSIYKGKDRSEPTSERHEITGNLVHQARKCIELLNTETYTAFDKNDNIPNQLKYPIRALQEAVVNCLVHRDYEIDQPSRITVFIDRIEIYSPGSLPRAIEREKFLKGKATPFWRNQSLAYFFNKLQLAQAEGQGVPTIFRTMKEEGCPSPIFEIEPESLTCILPAHPRHALVKEIHNIENDIFLGKNEQASNKLLIVLENDPYNFRALDLFCEVTTVLNRPKDLLSFLLRKNIDLEKLNSNTITNIAETIALIKDDDKLKEFANKLMKYAQSSALEEKQMERIAISMKKLGQNEELIEFVNNAISQNNSLSKNTILLENRARAKMDLAKKCIDTGRNSQEYNSIIRAKAWERARQYLNEAERDINNAMENVTSHIDEEYLKRDLEFLNKMKRIAHRPTFRRRDR
jgi:predicted HTH transcriptional regulator